MRVKKLNIFTLETSDIARPVPFGWDRLGGLGRVMSDYQIGRNMTSPLIVMLGQARSGYVRLPNWLEHDQSP